VPGEARQGATSTEHSPAMAMEGNGGFFPLTVVLGKLTQPVRCEHTFQLAPTLLRRGVKF